MPQRTAALHGAVRNPRPPRPTRDTDERARASTLSIGADGGTISKTVAPGASYVATETPKAGWALTSVVCDGNGTGDVGAGTATFTPAAGETVTCTFTNTKRPTLTVVKVVRNDDGGTAAAADWLMHVQSAGTDAVTPFAGSATGTTSTLPIGTYTVSESGGPGGYAAAFSGDCDASGRVTLAAGQDRTCTITNDDVRPELTVVKHVVNGDGGTAKAGDFALDVTATGAAPSSFPGSESGTTVALAAGAYAVAEPSHAGYSVSYSADCTGTIAVGEHRTCTVTNDDLPATLVVVKHVVDDNGGTAAAGDFSLTVTGSSPSPATFAGSESGTSVSLGAGSFSVAEGAHAGYTVAYDGCSGTIALGETKTCTVVNDDVQPQLTVIKKVVNDDGGTKTAADFTLTATGTNAAPASFAGSAAGTTVAVDAGSYSIAEPIHDGYAVSYSADCSGTIAVGEKKTCTVVNDDRAAQLTVIKQVVNDDGGTKTAADFTLAVSGTHPSPASFAGSADGTVVALGGGSYSVAEGAHAGYAVSYSAGCSGTIAVGEAKTCTVVNDDIRPQLTVVKKVVNDDGGTRAAADFTLAVSAAGASPASFPGSADGTAVALDAGTYSVTETAQAGYAASYSADCSGTIAVGEKKTCTVVNDDRPARLTLVKKVVNDNGGTALPGEWTLNVRADGKLVDAVSGKADGEAVTLAAGTYALDESGGPAGYAQASLACDGQAATSVTLSPGDAKTCTFTNDDVAPRLVVVKHVVNDDGGTASAADFTIRVTGTGAGPTTFPGSEAGTQVTLAAGAYSVSESGPSGYASSLGSGCAGTIAVGQVKSCTVTNDDTASPPPPPPPAPAPAIDLAITKVGSPDPALLGRRITWTLTVTNNGPDTATGVAVADVLPANATFVSVASSQGSCTLAGTLDCRLGTLAAGATAKVTVVTTPTATGLQVNQATVVGNEPEADTANNHAVATVLVTAPFRPPVVKPAPKPACTAVAVAPGTLTVGRLSALKALVTQARKPVAGARVGLAGPGISKLSGRTNAAGRVAVAVKPPRPGILKIRPVATKACGIQRVGIVGVFTPPVTG